MADLLLPPGVEPWMLLALAAAAFVAGVVDSVVGGGGLITIPVMFALFPRTAPAILIGTNKLISVCGTASAAVQFARRTAIDWAAVVPASAAALGFAFLGAVAATAVRPTVFRVLLPVVLIGVAAYVFARKDIGLRHAPRHRGAAARARGTAVGAVIGFYDGIFGPGTGSFLTFAFVHWFGFDFLRASAAAKVVNVACNVAGIAAFLIFADVWVAVGLAVAAANVLGSLAGTALALRLGGAFIRRLFLAVVVALIAKSVHDAGRQLVGG